MKLRTIRTKLIASFGLIIALLVLSGYLAISKMDVMGEASKETRDNWMPNVYVLGQMYGDVMDTQRILLRMALETDPAEMKRLEGRIQEVLGKTEASRKLFLSMPHSAEDRQIYDQFSTAYDQYVKAFPPLIELARANRFEEFNTQHNKAHEHFKKATDLIAGMTASIKKGSDAQTESVQKTYTNGRLFVLILVITAGIAALALALVVSSSIAGTVTRLKRSVEQVKNGDLTDTVSIKSRDELGQMGDAVNEMIHRLREVLGKTSYAAQSVSGASQEISASTQEIASGTQDQSRAARMINELLQELARAIDAVAHNAESAADLSNQTLMEAQKGGDVLRASVQGMKNLNMQMERLQEDSTKIGEIIEVIDDIADQTNLLALNAAIEAARAGEQGRGFAVVADEVRKLAERSGEATKQIASIIKTMQSNTLHSVTAVQEAVVLSGRTGETFEEIVRRVSATSEQAAEIAAACEEQSAQGKEVLQTVETIVAASEQVAAATEETASASQSMAQLAQDMSLTIAYFKLK
ncbi:methyl-accepting chemotaxis protein [Gorillibacterium sp. sgz5001074]|uniref:methyl-accepting chemotaxis protein n=1 Tax=Gorillibacterium sp. sgz5001074 TaxID=3446695 RepID=UPI003F66FD8D